MSNTETYLVIWIGFVSGVVVYLALERDRLLKKIRFLEHSDNATRNWLGSQEKRIRKIYEVICSADNQTKDG